MNDKYVQLEVSDTARAAVILEQKLGISEYSVQADNILRIYKAHIDMALVNKTLMLENISVISSQLCNDTLEDYFKKITGGEGIA